MRRTTMSLALMVMLALSCAAAMASSGSLRAGRLDDKLPKCSMKLCRDTGCSPDTLCVSGAHVKSCADVCNGN